MSAPLLDATDRVVIDRLQDGLPLVERPYARVAAELELSEADLLARLRRLLEAGVLSRFGPMYHAERMGGGLTLAAIAVPEDRYEAVAETVNAFAEVAHNYARAHALNMWFVLATETPDRIAEVIAEIEAATGLTVHDMPKRREFYVGLRLSAAPADGEGADAGFARAGVSHPLSVSSPSRGRGPAASVRPLSEGKQSGSEGPFPLDGGRTGWGWHTPARETPPDTRKTTPLDATDRAIVEATQAGLPLAADPWAEVAGQTGLDAAEVRTRMARMLDDGIIRRIAAVPNHYKLGYRANGMSVWDVPDDRIAELGAEVGGLDFVSHAYERPRHPPIWPYNLFAMVHGRTADEVEAKVARIADLLGAADRGHAILYSTRILKKTGLRLTGGPGRR